MEDFITLKSETMPRGFTVYKVFKKLPSGTWKYIGIARGEGQRSIWLADLRIQGFEAKAEEVILINGKYVSAE